MSPAFTPLNTTHIGLRGAEGRRPMARELSEQQVGQVLQMLEAWPATQRKLKTGTALKSTRDGHPHRDLIIGDQGTGAPTHHARRGALYLGSDDIQYINTSAQPGGTTWSLVGGGGASGAHTLDNPIIHTDVAAQTNQNGDLLVRIADEWDRLGVPAFPFRSYLRGGVSPTAVPAWSDTVQPQLFKFPPATSLTLSSNTNGEISLSGGSHAFINTLASASTGDLATVTGAAPNSFYILRPAVVGHTIVIKHGVGSFLCIGNADITLSNVHDFVICIAPSTNVLYVMFGGPGVGGGTTKYHIAYNFGGDNLTGADFPPPEV